jgi:hypothetical protein
MKVALVIVSLLVITAIVIIIVSFSSLTRIVKIAIISVAIITFLILSIVIGYRMRSKKAESVKAIETKGMSTESVKRTVTRGRGTDIVIGEERIKPTKQESLDPCFTFTDLKISKENEGFFNIFIIFISNMRNLVNIGFVDISRIAEILSTDFNIYSSIVYVDKLLSLFMPKGFKIRNFENIFRLSHIQELGWSKQSYAIRELKINLALLLAASSKETFITRDDYTEFAYTTLSNAVSRYRLSSVDFRDYLHSFFKYLNRFRVSEILFPEESFYLIKRIKYSLSSIDQGIQFMNANITGTLDYVSEVPYIKPMYVIITFDPDSSIESKWLNKFKLKGYKARTAILDTGDNNMIISLRDDNTLCLVTDKNIKEGSEPMYYQEASKNNLLELIAEMKDIKFPSKILCLLYEYTKKATSSSTVGEIGYRERSILPLVNKDNFSNNMNIHKNRFKELIMDRFSKSYNEFKVNRNSNIFQTIKRILDFIKMCTDGAGENNSVIKTYLFPNANKEPDKLFIAPFIERMINEFLRIEFRVTFNKEPEELWNSISTEIEFYQKDPDITTSVLLKNAVEVMKLFTHILPNVSLEELGKDQRIHSDYILATIYLIKRLWKIYDACLMVMKLLAEKSTLNEEEKLLYYLLLKFNTLIYVESYFVPFSDKSRHNEDLNKRRLELEKHISSLQLNKSNRP